MELIYTLTNQNSYRKMEGINILAFIHLLKEYCSIYKNNMR